MPRIVSVITRASKGSRLTHGEVDGNFTALANLVNVISEFLGIGTAMRKPVFTKLWQKTNTGEPIYSTPIFVQDFTCSTYTGPVFIYQSWDWYLYVVKASDGSTVWRYPFGDANYGRPQYVNHGGTQRIFGASHDGHIYCLDENGNKLWHVANLYSREGSGSMVYQGGGVFTDSAKSWANRSFLRSESSGDQNARAVLDGLGTMPILACNGSSITLDTSGFSPVIGSSYAYTIQPRYPSDVFYQHAGTAKVESGVVYLYVCGFDGQCIKINANTGAIQWKFSTLENIEPFPLVDQIDNSGVARVVVSSVDGNIYILNSSNGAVLSVISGREGFDAYVCIGELKSGNSTKFVVSGCRDGRVYSINGATKAVDSVSSEFPALAGNDIDAGCALLPLPGGGFDVVMASDPGWLACLDSGMNIKWRKMTGMLHNATPRVVPFDTGQMILSFDMGGGITAHDPGGVLLGQYFVKGGIEGTPYVGDIDGDGKLEMLVTTLDGNVYLLKIS